LKSELGGIFEDVIIALMLPTDQYLCKQLNKAMDGLGTEEQTLIEILCPMSNEEIKTLVPCYEESRLRVMNSG
jgi:annexin A7/11